MEMRLSLSLATTTLRQKCVGAQVIVCCSIALRSPSQRMYVPFLAKLPNSYKFAIEIRNRNWLDAEFATLLRARSVALVLQDRSWMPSPSELKFDPITAAWTWLWPSQTGQTAANQMYCFSNPQPNPH